MSSTLSSLCYICYDPDDQDLWRCVKCNVISVHKECASLFRLEQITTPKKIKYEDSIYSQIRAFPQLQDSQYSEAHKVWVCNNCQEHINRKIACHFCCLTDGLMAKITFQDQEKDGKRKNMEGEEDDPKLAHLNCILRLYGKRPTLNSSDRYFILEEDILADAPNCKACGPPYKLDVKCTKCNTFFTHNLCLNNEKTDAKLCSSCFRPEVIQPKIDARSVKAAEYLSIFFKEIISSKEYDEFCAEKSISKEENIMNLKDEEPEIRITNHYFEFNEKNELTYAFPFAKKEFFGEQNSPLAQNHEILQESELKVEYQAVDQQGTDNRIQDEYKMKKADFSDGNEIIKVEKEEKKNDERISPKKEEFNLEVEEDSSQINKPGLEKIIKQSMTMHYISSFQVLAELKNIYMEKSIDKDNPFKLKITRKWYSLLSSFGEKDEMVLKVYDEKIKKEILDEFSIFNKYRVPTETWPMIPKSYRKYEWLEEFVMSIESDSFRKEIDKLLTTRKSHKCTFACDCSSVQKLGPYLHDKQSWDTSCPGRAGLTECDENCGCDLTVCKNRAISTGGRKKLDEEVKETFCWGIDYSTHHDICSVLPNIEGVDKDAFIEKKLLRAVHHAVKFITIPNVNNIKKKPWDMIDICKQIIKKSKEGSKLYDEKDCVLAKMLIRAIRFVKPFDDKAFRLHSKGYGVICIKEDGIEPNDLISEYYGEMYTPWRWFEKQDLVKKYLKEKNKKNQLPDFYNIILERHKDDPDGYDIIIVDPINKGNYPSRFSHSCDPNCGTVPTISKGKYGIAMYSLRPLSFGEELTFDYFSVTENEREFKQAICLCGTKNCRVHYLNLITSKNQNSYLEENLCFLKRNFLIYKCVEPLKPEDFELLETYSFRSSILTDCPSWLKKWIVLILMFVKEEKMKYVEYNFQRRKSELEGQLKHKPTPEMIENLRKNLEIEKFTLEGDRIQNLTITVNKIKHVLALIKEKVTNKPPTINKPKPVKVAKESNMSPPEIIPPKRMTRSSKRGSENKSDRKVVPDSPNNLDFETSDPSNAMVLENSPKKQITANHIDNSINNSPQQLQKEFSQDLKSVTLQNKENMKIDRQDSENTSNTNDLNEVANDLQAKKQDSIEDKKEGDISHDTMLLEANYFENRAETNPDDPEPPFKRMSLHEICNNLLDLKVMREIPILLKQNAQSLARIFSKSEGVIDEALVCIGKLNLKPEAENMIKNALLDLSTLITQNPNDHDFIFYGVRKLCLDLSNILCKIPASTFIDCQGMSDILYFYSVTFTYFTNYNYPSVFSKEKASVRKCDIPDFTRYFSDVELTPKDEAEVLKADTKIYSSSYIWAQMTIWWKQTVEKPEATLSQERRGTLSYPTFEQSFVHKSEGSSKEYDYPYVTRGNWLRKLVDSPSASWPIFKKPKRNLHTWSFRNDNKMYGTFLLEEVAFEGKYKNFVESVVKILEKSFDEDKRSKLFFKINGEYFKRINYKLPIKIAELPQDCWPEQQ